MAFLSHSMEKMRCLRYLLEKVTDRQMISVCRCMKYKRMEAQENIFEQGQRGKDAFVILSGGVRLIEPGPNPVLRATLRPGDSFGELSCLGLDSSSTAVATCRTELMLLSREDFLKSIGWEDGVGLQLEQAS